jgi:hypothetical protein
MSFWDVEQMMMVFPGDQQDGQSIRSTDLWENKLDFGRKAIKEEKQSIAFQVAYGKPESCGRVVIIFRYDSH